MNSIQTQTEGLQRQSQEIQTLFSEIKEKIGISYTKDSIIESVIKAEYFPAKSLSDEDFKKEFGRVLTIVIDAYFGATNGTSIITIQECADIFKSKYMNLSIDEIRSAARFSIENELENKTYYGQFTCSVFVEMINKYIAHRQVIKIAMLESKNKKEKELEDKINFEKKEKDFEIYANQWMDERLQKNDIHDYKQISFALANFWYQRLNPDPQLKILSMDLAKKEMEAERLDNFYKGNKLKADQIFRALTSGKSDPIIAYAKPIYMRLLTLEYIKKNNISLSNDSEVKKK